MRLKEGLMTTPSSQLTKGRAPTGHHLEDADRTRLRVVIVGFLVAACIALVGLGWWQSGQSGSEVADTPGVDRHVAGLDILDAYFVRGASPHELTLVCALTTSQGGDRLMGVSAGGGATARLAAATPRAKTEVGLPVTSSRLLQIGPEQNATALIVTGVTGSVSAGSYLTTTFDFAHRGSVSMSLPIWDSVLGASGR
jgi:hypothetical protein